MQHDKALRVHVAARIAGQLFENWRCGAATRRGAGDWQKEWKGDEEAGS